MSLQFGYIQMDSRWVNILLLDLEWVEIPNIHKHTGANAEPEGSTEVKLCKKTYNDEAG